MILKHVLLCYPSHFRVDYVINPWMKIGSVNLALAELQWQQLVEAYKLAKIEVSLIKQHRSCPDMVFAADEGLAIFKNTLLLSKFRYPERQPETKFYDDWLTQHNFQLLKIPYTKFFFKGSGDC